MNETKIWAITVKEPYCGWLLSGKKNLEIRVRIPKDLQSGDFIYVIQKGTKGMVVGMFMVDTVIAGHPISMYEKMKELHCIGEADFMKYAGGRTQIYGIKMHRIPVSILPCNMSILGLKSVPQSFTKILV